MTAAAQEVGSAEDDGDSKLDQGRLDEALAAYERALGDCDDNACTTRLHGRIADVNPTATAPHLDSTNTRRSGASPGRTAP